jgi:hypothetical protein
LVTPLDAKHNKPGDPVVAKTTQDVKQNGQVVLKKGSRLDGHVTQAQARSSGSAQSSLGVLFDSVTPKKGQPMPMNLSVQALAASATQTSASIADDQAIAGSAGQAGLAGGAMPAGGGAARGGGGALGGVGGTVGAVTNTAAGATGNVGQSVNGTAGATARTVASAGSGAGLNSAGQLMSNSSGVVGLQGLSLTSAVSNATQGSVVNSTSRNVHLDSGTQMVLQVVKQ